MDTKIIDCFLNNEEKIRAALVRWITDSAEEHRYDKLFSIVLKEMYCDDSKGFAPPDSEALDWEHIAVIDFGAYQGTLVFVVANPVYEPAPYEHFVTWVHYGSCGLCDTLQWIIDDIYKMQLNKEFIGLHSAPINGLWTIALHMIQHLRPIS